MIINKKSVKFYRNYPLHVELGNSPWKFEHILQKGLKLKFFQSKTNLRTFKSCGLKLDLTYISRIGSIIKPNIYDDHNHYVICLEKNKIKWTLWSGYE